MLLPPLRARGLVVRVPLLCLVVGLLAGLGVALVVLLVVGLVVGLRLRDPAVARLGGWAVRLLGRGLIPGLADLGEASLLRGRFLVPGPALGPGSGGATRLHVANDHRALEPATDRAVDGVRIQLRPTFEAVGLHLAHGVAAYPKRGGRRLDLSRGPSGTRGGRCRRAAPRAWWPPARTRRLPPPRGP